MVVPELGLLVRYTNAADYKAGRLSHELDRDRIAKLNALGFDWGKAEGSKEA